MSLKPKTKIFLDLDGVITEFSLSAMAFHGAWIPDESYYPQDCGWDVLKATNTIRELGGLPPLSAKDFWDSLNYNFWRHLRMYPGALQFLMQLEVRGEVFLATSPTLSSQCVAGKFDWIKENLPSYLRRHYIGAAKEEFAKPGAILIDDRDRNCERFEAAGGKAILVPRPWNDRGMCQTDVYETVMWEVRALCD